MHVHARKVFIGQLVRDRDGYETGIAATTEADLVGYAFEPLIRQLNQRGDLRERMLWIVSLFRCDRDAARSAVRGQRPSKPIKDTPALRRGELQLDMVGLGLCLIAFLIEDLQLEQTRNQAGPYEAACSPGNCGTACPASSPGLRPRSNIFWSTA